MSADRVASSGPAPPARGRQANRPGAFLGLLGLFIIIILVATPGAQAPETSVLRGMSVAGVPAAPEPTAIDLLVGRSTILNVSAPIERVSLTTPDIADALVTSPQQLLIHGKTPGTISLFVWDRAGGIRTYEVNVRRDLSELKEQMRQLFVGEGVAVASNGKDVVISGTVRSQYVIDKATDVAAGYVENRENVVNLLRLQEGIASNQVLLRVRFAEVSRNALQELGASYFTGVGGHKDYVARATTQQFAAPEFDDDRGLVFSDFLNLVVFNTKEQLGTLLKALQTRGLLQSLAEPNLIAQNGTEASFLAGGEYPYPVLQGGATAPAVTIQFKEFGIRLSFTPTVLGNDLIHLKVRPEVSTLDFANSVSIEGFRVPALSTRRTETEVELRNGQTFAIAGLLNNTVTETMRKIPGIGDIPILGLLFRSRAHQKQQTELVVMITPEILPQNSTGAARGLPDLAAPFLEAPRRSGPPPPPYAPDRREPEPPQAASAPPSSGGSTAPGAVPAAPSATATAPATPSPAELKRLAAEERKRAEEERKRLERERKEQAKREKAEQERQAKLQAEADKRAKEEQKRQAEIARRETEAQRKVDEVQRKADEAQRKADEAQRRAEEAQRRAEEARRKAEEERQKKEEEKLGRERADREAEAARRAEQLAKQRAESERRRNRPLVEATERLHAAEAAYLAAVEQAQAQGTAPDSRREQRLVDVAERLRAAQAAYVMAVQEAHVRAIAEGAEESGDESGTQPEKDEKKGGPGGAPSVDHVG